LIGKQKIVNLNTDEWKTALKTAGYPDSDQLPKDYRYAAAEPAAPKAPPPPEPEVAPKVNKPRQAPQPKEPESKIRF